MDYRRAEAHMLQPADSSDSAAYNRVAAPTAADPHGTALQTAKLAALAEFAAGAGHEINNPLAVICGRVELLLRQETHPEKRRDLATIESQARRIYEMIADLMLFARPPLPELAIVDVSLLFDELANELTPLCAEREIELRVTKQTRPLPLTADGRQLLVALRAICDNALEAMDRGGRLSITAEDCVLSNTAGEATPSRAVRMVVQDTGPGFDDHVREHLFDPFFSGRSAGRRLGMGLAKAWRIAQLHHGTILAENAPGGGAQFVVTLPVGQSRDEHATSEPLAASHTNGRE